MKGSIDQYHKIVSEEHPTCGLSPVFKLHTHTSIRLVGCYEGRPVAQG